MAGDETDLGHMRLRLVNEGKKYWHSRISMMKGGDEKEVARIKVLPLKNLISNL